MRPRERTERVSGPVPPREPVFERLFGPAPVKDAVRVLSFDGGGIRGIIPAMLAAEIEARTKMAIADLFDYVAGTSTGAILALGVTVPGTGGRARYGATFAVETYANRGHEIFERDDMAHRLRSLNPLEPKYESVGLERVLNETFGDVWLSEAMTEVLVTAYKVCEREIQLFSSADAAGDEDLDYRMVDVVRAATAAPTFFEPREITSRAGRTSLVLIDGGVYANNPAMCAFAEAERRQLHQDMIMVSLGTGTGSRSFDWPGMRHWGLAQWARPIIHMLIDGSAQSAHHQLAQLLGPARYHRFQVVLEERADALDDASSENIERLLSHGKQLIASSDAELDQLCGWLTS